VGIVRDTVAVMRVLLTGATGYVGDRLLPLLEAGGYRVRCLARHSDHLMVRVRNCDLRVLVTLRWVSVLAQLEDASNGLAS
jgi:nucleoside-diphosphate-sugar epimerase